jgi:DNA helicase-2/ATP-dependent DNA helicase PcrA
MKLSEMQLSVVNADDSNMIVCAGAGSGKTRVLVERVKRLIKSGANPDKVVIITYTNNAADELISRLKDTKDADKCFIGTIHSYAYKLLRRTNKDFEIFSEVQQTKFMKYLIDKYGYRCTFHDYEEFLKYERLASIGKIQQSRIAEKFSDISVYNEIIGLLGRGTSYAYKETVKTLCMDNNVLTFDDLIEQVTQNGEIPHIEHLFVDEFQDVGYLEYNFLMWLKADHNFVIGDDFQSIFGFNGGDVQIFLSLMHNADWKSYYLTENYRTAKMILSYAMSVIKKANDIIDKTVIPMRKEQGQLNLVGKALLESSMSEFKKGDWFILTRTNKELSYLCSVLKQHNMNFVCLKHGEVVESGGDSDNKNIVAMTVHTAKGMECDNVAIYGKFPVAGKGQSDELKVFYVALTRAKDRCLVFV